jgi:putative ABC transport system ATP-binding protein
MDSEGKITREKSGIEDLKSLLSLRGIARDFFDGTVKRRVLQATDFDLRTAELTVLAGPSGSGKTTLLSIIGLVLNPSQVKISLNGRDVTGLNDNQRATIRLKEIGFVFQQPALVAGLSILDNVLIALAVQGAKISKESRQRALELLSQLGLDNLENRQPQQLSGGQKQRVSIARALVKAPELILCDEPTSALDAESGKVVMEYLKKTALLEKRSIIVVSHDARVFPYADRLVKIENGVLVSDTKPFKAMTGPGEEREIGI